ncbi:MAG: N-acetylmuramoyl-L-alanine amidase [Desulfarculales bacterium]|jgi:N-acetylmuramoyl-L-alanine amidase|nr:N-acetylmuramoyl-L-alanine amidase [Desulfarculales bacterium]
MALIKTPRNFCLGLILLLTGIGAGGETAWAAGAMVAVEQSFNQARQEYETVKRSNDLYQWQVLGQRFMALYNSQNNGDLAPRCLFWAGRVSGEAYNKFKQPEDFGRAVRAYDLLIQRFPASNLADDAQYAIAGLYKSKGDLKQAYLEYLKVKTNFPKGDMSGPALSQAGQLEPLLNKPPAPPLINTPSPAAPVLTRPNISKINDIRQWSVPGYARVVLNLESPAPYSTRLLRGGMDSQGEKRLQLDLSQASLDAAVAPIVPAAQGLLRAVQYSAPEKDQVRVLITLQDLTSYKVFTLDNPFRLVVDCFSGAYEAQASSAGGSVPPVAPGPSTSHRVPRGQAAAQPSQIGLAAQLGLQVRTVVLDPGHGGKDPGASSNKVVEKNITLQLAKLVSAKLRQYLPECKVLLTRSQDVFIPLEERTAFANTKGADLFVSIHVNAAPSAKLNGIETYFLNLATDEDAMRVAARENATTQRSLNDLQTILNDLMLNSKINESNRLARMVQREMLASVERKHKVTDLKVKQAPFYVLIGARMPAILCEVGFVTNSSERSRLTGEAYLNLLAEGIAQGIVKYNQELQQAVKGSR